MSKLKRVLLGSFLTASLITTPIIITSCSWFFKPPKAIPSSEPNVIISNQKQPNINQQTNSYNPNIFKFNDYEFKIAKEDNDKQLKTEAFLNEIKNQNKLSTYLPNKDQVHGIQINVFDNWVEYPTLAKASSYINYHEPILTNQTFNANHLKNMLDELQKRTYLSVEELKKESEFRRNHLFQQQLAYDLRNKIDFKDDKPDNLGKYHEPKIAPKPTHDNDPNYSRHYNDLKNLPRKIWEIGNWTEEDRWNYYKSGNRTNGTFLWYLNRVIIGSADWNTKFKNSQHNSPFFLSRMLTEPKLTEQQQKDWQMDFIMYNFMNQSSLLMSTGEQYDLYKAYLEYLVILGDLNLHQIQEQQTNGKKISKEEQYNAKLLTTITKLRELEQLALKTLQANYLLGFTASQADNPNLQLFAGNTTLKNPTNLRSFYQWTANLYNRFIQPLLYKLQVPKLHIELNFKNAFEPNDKSKKIFNFIWSNLVHTDQANVKLPKLITDTNDLESDYSKILNKLLNATN